MVDLPDGGGPDTSIAADGPTDRPPGLDGKPTDLAVDVATDLAVDVPMSIVSDGPTDASKCEFRVTEGPDVGATACPRELPVEGGACKFPGGNGKCDYRNGCDNDVWQCFVDGWRRTTLGRSCRECPAEPPMNGAQCDLAPSSSGFECTWTVPGGISYARCGYCRWTVAQTKNPAHCPATLPMSGAPCTDTSGTTCWYASACHNVDRALCTAGRWQVEAGKCN